MVACASTLFARNVMATAEGNLPGKKNKARLRSSVGFLTSTTAQSYSSAICVSQDPNLVYLFDDPRKRGPDNLAPGYRLHNSMFGRQFLWLWTYTFSATADVTVAGLVSRMNPARPTVPPAPPAAALPRQTPPAGAAPPDAEAPPGSVNRYGFDAFFVGDADRFGALPLSEFFPLGVIDEATPVPHSSDPNMTFAKVIPCRELGGFFDDLPNFCEAEDFQGRFVEIAIVGDRVDAVEPRPARLHEWLGADHPIMKHISLHSALEGQADDTGDGGNFVPWDDLWFEFESLVRAKGWKCLNGTRQIEDLLPIFTAYLEDLNGCFLPVWAFEFMCPMAAYACAQEEQDVKDLIKLAHDHLMAKMREDAPASPLPE
jgi:hypothetical protein